MIPCVITRFFASMTIPFFGQECRHTSGDVIMAIMHAKTNKSFFFLRPRVNDVILMLFRSNVDLVLGQMGLKLLDFISKPQEPTGTPFFVQIMCQTCLE